MTDHADRLTRAFLDLNALVEEHGKAMPSPLRDAAAAFLTREMILGQADPRWIANLSASEVSDFVAFVGSAFTMGVQVGWHAAHDNP
jgi:hypothetical protein